MEVTLNPDAVEFDEVACCAMERASIQEAHQVLIKECVAAMGEIHPIYKASLFLGVFQYTVHLVFIPHAGHRTLYSTLASAEKNILEQEQDKDKIFECGHTVQNHCDALDTINVKMTAS